MKGSKRSSSTAGDTPVGKMTPAALHEATQETRHRLRKAEAGLWVSLEQAGDRLAAELGYERDGLDAIYKFLIERHHWLPADVRALSLEDLELCMDGAWPGDTGGTGRRAATPRAAAGRVRGRLSER